MDQTPKKQNMQLTPRHTPIKQTRPYLTFANQKLNQQVHQNHHSGQTPRMIQQIYEQEQEQDEGIIYGTNISIVAATSQLTEFIETFQIINPEEQTVQKIYLNKLQDIDLDLIDKNLFQIQGRHLKEFDYNLYYQIIYYPAQMITLLDQALKNLYQKHYIDVQKDANKIQVKTQKKNMLMVSIIKLQKSQVTLMRKLKQKYINRLVSYQGIVIRCSQILPQMKTATFRCINKKCKSEVYVDLQNAKVQEPKICQVCKSRESFQLIHQFCHFTDKQYIKFQELPQFVPQGQTPTSMSIVCYDNNANGMRPGDRVEIVGIFRSRGKKVFRGRSNLETIFYTFTDLISFKILEENKFKASLADCKTAFSDEDKQKFSQIANSPNVVDDLVEGFASSIYGHQNIKKGLLTQIFGGTHKQFEGRGRFRSDINICLVGDPSTAKSQLLKQVHTISPRGIYTSGKSSSAVGLTANVKKDPQTKEFILQSGALVLSDLGVCCIDQFDKMDQNSKLILLEAMQQQTISVAKAGIVCQLNSRTSILAAANPILSKYDPKRSVVDNINLPPALLSRFDLIYIILDIPNKIMDTKLAQHILSLYSQTGIVQNTKIQSKISREILVKYITYARQYVSPKITEKAGKKLTECYLEMRKLGSGRGAVSATPRQLQSMIRISEAFAKMKLSRYVQQDDILNAYELIKEALKQSATDPNTGMIDMDIIVTGTSSASKKHVSIIMEILRKLFQGNKSQFQKSIKFHITIDYVTQNWPKDQLYPKPKEQDIKNALQKLNNQGDIILFGSDKNRPTFKLCSSSKY